MYTSWPLPRNHFAAFARNHFADFSRNHFAAFARNHFANFSRNTTRMDMHGCKDQEF